MLDISELIQFKSNKNKLDKLLIDNVLDVNIIVDSFEFQSTIYGDRKGDLYAKLYIKFDESDSLHVINTASKVIISQLEHILSKGVSSFTCRILKINQYYKLFPTE